MFVFTKWLMAIMTYMALHTVMANGVMRMISVTCCRVMPGMHTGVRMLHVCDRRACTNRMCGCSFYGLLQNARWPAAVVVGQAKLQQPSALVARASKVIF